jgi:outer membrane biosynthesis protein TonB
MPTQPEFDGLAREFVFQLESRAEGVMATGLASEGDEVLARFEQAVKGIAEAPSEAAAEVVAETQEFDPERNVMAMAAEIPEDVKEELVEEKVEEEAEPEPPKKKPRKVQKREPQVPRKPKIIKAVAAHASASKKAAPVAKKK